MVLPYYMVLQAGLYGNCINRYIYVFDRLGSSFLVFYLGLPPIEISLPEVGIQVRILKYRMSLFRLNLSECQDRVRVANTMHWIRMYIPTALNLVLIYRLEINIHVFTVQSTPQWGDNLARMQARRVHVCSGRYYIVMLQQLQGAGGTCITRDVVANSTMEGGAIFGDCVRCALEYVGFQNKMRIYGSSNQCTGRKR